MKNARPATVNGEPLSLSGDVSRSLLFVLRDELGLTGAKPACGEGVCGACTVLADGVAIRSCITPLEAVAGRSVTTIEGLDAGGELHPVQQAFLAEGAFQCGYCTPGMVLATVALLERDPRPTDDVIVGALDGNVCRCCTYPRILRAVRRAADPASPAVAEPSPNAAVPPPLIDARKAPWHLRSPEERDYFEALGDGLVVVLPPPEGEPSWAGAWTTTGGVWLHVGGDGVVTAFTGKMEMGQDNTTALAMIVADAIGVRLESVRMVLADTDVCPYDEGTFGSRSTPDAGAMLQAAGWTALETLVELAADRLEVSPADLVQGEGAIRSRDGARAIRHGELLTGVRRIKEVHGRPDRPSAAAGPTIGGRPAASVAGLAAVTGRRPFVTDISRPGMLHGRALGPPVAGATLRSVDVSRAREVPGVTVLHDGDFVGVTGPDVGSVDLAMAAIRADWDVPSGPSETDLEGYLRAHPVDAEGWDGNFEHDFGRRRRRARASRDTGHGNLHRGIRRSCPPRVTGSGRGMGRRAGDRMDRDAGAVLGAGGARRGARPERGSHPRRCATDGRRVRRQARGGGRNRRGATRPRSREPVKVRWRHAEEFALGHARPAAVIDVRAAAAPDLTVTSWEFRTLNAGPSAITPPYRIANQRLRYQPADGPLPQSSYRALAATANVFARESAIDELAHGLGADPLSFRLANVDDDRLAAALRAVSERAGWGRRFKDTGHGLGIAGAVEKDARVATCAEVQVRPDGRVDVVRLVTAFDCGAIVNPDNLSNQVEGAAVMALGPALFEAVHFENGRITNDSLSSYRVPRFRDTPVIEVVLIDRPELPSVGGGEVPLIAVAPAIANAIFAASGRRIRAMPLLPDTPPNGGS